MSSTTWLPSVAAGPGYLPYYLFVNALLCWYNSLQCFGIFPSQVTRQYAGPAAAKQITGLQSRRFGSWTFQSGFVRMYAAYHITNPPVFALGTVAYVSILRHYFLELLVYGTMRWDLRAQVSFATDIVGLVWMWAGWYYGWYV